MSIALAISPALEASARSGLQHLIDDGFAGRLRARDATLWGSQAQSEASQRLGWIDPFARSAAVLDEALELRASLNRRGIDRVVLCGMGGSSLGPEVVAREAGAPLRVLDSTHPDEVRRALAGDLSRTVAVISSKSGSTIETSLHSLLFERAFEAAALDPREHLVYVTDPGSPFAARASDGYRVFLADPEVGGRFSVLTAFGIVPTALAGADAARLLEDARAMQEVLCADEAGNPALRLAAVLAAGLPERYALLLAETADPRIGLGDWIEQLVAESTGKHGKGLLPIALPSDASELQAPPEQALVALLGIESAPNESPDGEDSSTKPIGADLSILGSLGAQLLLWEVATAALGRLMGINPFDQPDVETAKQAARAVLASDTGTPALHPLPGDDALVAELRDLVPDNGYVALQAFIDRESAAGDRARLLRRRLSDALEAPVSLGWGPRYLHSTGQLHKGGPALGVFVQIVDSSCEPLSVPGGAGELGALLRAQAHGDREVLERRGRPVLAFAL